MYKENESKKITANSISKYYAKRHSKTYVPVKSNFVVVVINLSSPEPPTATTRSSLLPMLRA